MTRLDFPFPQITACDLDIAVLGQLLAANLPLSNKFEPSSVDVVGFEAAFGRRGVCKQNLENAPGNNHHTLIFADAYAEFDGGAFGIPSRVGRETKEHCHLLGGQGIMFM
jgi:hypothetical protein